jgi:hypothetical protein
MASPPPIDVVSIVLGAVAGVALDRIASAAEAWLRRHRSLEDLREQTREIQRFLFVAVANGP